MKKVNLFLFSFLLLMMILSADARAGYYTIYGLGSRASAMGGANIALVNDPSASYYNPGALSECGDGKLEMIVFHNFPQLKAEFKDDSGSLLTQALGKGFTYLREYEDWTKNVDELTAMGIGLAMPIWKSPLLKNIEFGMSFSAPLSWAAKEYFVESKDPIFLEYFDQSSKFNILGGMSYDIDGIFKSLGDIDIPGISVGFGVNAFVDERGTLKMKPTDFKLWLPYDYTIIGGALLQPFQHFDNRFLRGLKLGATYHQAMMLDLTFDMGLISNGSGGYAVEGSFTSYNFYFPEELGFGLGFAPQQNLSIEYDIVRQGWSDYKPPFVNADPKSMIGMLMIPFDFENYKLRDIWVHRIGFEYTLAEDYKFRLGYGYRPTPLSSEMTYRSNILDNDIHTISFGLGYVFEGLTVNVHSQVRMMAERTLHNDGNSIKAGGNVWSTGFTLSRNFQTK